MKEKYDIKNKKTLIQTALIVLILFVNATLYNEKNIQLYIKLSTMLILISGIYIIKNIGSLKTFIKMKFFWWITFVFLMFEFYGYAKPVYGNFNWDYLIFLYLNVVTMALILVTIPIDSQIETITQISAITSILIGIYIVINEYSAIKMGSTRIGTSGSGNVNTIGTYFSIFSIPVLYEVIVKKNWKYLPIFAVQFAFMLLTGSKKTLIFIFGGILIYYIYSNGIKIIKVLKLICIFLFLFIIILKVDLFYNIIGYRLENFFEQISIKEENQEVSYSTFARIEMYKSAPKLFLENPIFGGGWGYFAERSGLGVYSHSNFIEILITFGLSGFLLYYSYYAIVLRKSVIQVIQHKSVIPFCYMVLLIFNDFSVITFSQIPICYIVVFISNILLKQNNRKEKNEN